MKGILLTIMVLALALVGCGNSGGSTGAGSGQTPGATITVTLSPSSTTTERPNIMVAVRLRVGRNPAPETTISMAVDAGGLAAPGTEPPGEDESLPTSLEITSDRGTASAWWRVPSEKGTYRISVFAMGLLATREIEVTESED